MLNWQRLFLAKSTRLLTPSLDDGGPPQREQREAGAANYCPFRGEGRFVYIGKLLKVHISPEANSLDLKT